MDEKAEDLKAEIAFAKQMQFAVRDWLRANGIRCPRCGGAAQGYSTWIVQGEQCQCDNCGFPAQPAADFSGFGETGYLPDANRAGLFG